MKSQDILNCSFPLWYKHFKENTIESVVLKLPKVFIEYLSADGIFLPDSSDSQTQADSDESSDDSQNFITSGGGDHTISQAEMKVQDLVKTDEFRELQNDVVTAIAELGGKVFPKLNWSSPRDASWIAVNGSLCCETLNDICLLFKSSDFIAHDLTDPFLLSAHSNSDSVPQIEYVLVLKRWIEIIPSGEYRCFVKDKQLIAISQRSSQYFSHIESAKDSIVEKINRFFRRVAKGTFPNDSYSFDIYLPGAGQQPLLLDFNPFTNITDSLLFSWEELTGEEGMSEVAAGSLIRDVVFRCVTSEG